MVLLKAFVNKLTRNPAVAKCSRSVNFKGPEGTLPPQKKMLAPRHVCRHLWQKVDANRVTVVYIVYSFSGEDVRLVLFSTEFSKCYLLTTDNKSQTYNYCSLHLNRLKFLKQLFSKIKIFNNNQVLNVLHLFFVEFLNTS